MTIGRPERIVTIKTKFISPGHGLVDPHPQQFAFGSPKQIDVGESIFEMKQVTKVLDTQNLQNLVGMFKMSMKTNFPKVLENLESLVNLIWPF